MNRPSPRVLVLGSDGLRAFAPFLEGEGHPASSVSTAEQALSRTDSEHFDVVIVDMRDGAFPGFVAAHTARFPDIPLVVVTPEQGSDGKDALRDGAAEAVSWPCDIDHFAHALKRALARAASASVNPPPPTVTESKLLGVSPKIQRVRELIERVAPGDATVLIRGETGTGKELVARALHESSDRRDKPFVKTHVAALPDSLLESELFGYEKGAFTGAAVRKPGRVELAEGGSLFLDEIGEISPVVQAKLLRLIQDREYERLGGTRALKANVRFIAATHRDLEHMTQEGAFREDLFYRLNVVSIWLPPLRARRDDIPLLARSYAANVAEHGKRPPVEFDDSALALLRSQRWPGNVRQLLNLVERLVVLAPAPVLTADHVKNELEEQVAFSTQSSQAAVDDGAEVVRAVSVSEATSSVRPLREEVQRAERRALEKALKSSKGNRTLAARLLGVSRRTLYTKLDEHGLT
jgi:two-component system response regulator AtoC